MLFILYDLMLLLSMILWFMLSILIHEAGHYAAAIRAGLKVEQFSLGIGNSLFSWNFGSTCFSIRNLPLGGYVRIPALDLRNCPEAPNVTTKILIYLAGPFANLILAAGLACILWLTGISTDTTRQTTIVGYVKNQYTSSPVSSDFSFFPGDKIKTINNIPVRNWIQISAILLGNHIKETHTDFNIVIERNKNGITRLLQLDLLDGYSQENIIGPAGLVKLYLVNPGSLAETIGLIAGDQIIAINKYPVLNPLTLEDAFKAEAGNTIIFTIKREERTFEVPITIPADLKDSVTNIMGWKYTQPEKIRQFIKPLTQLRESLIMTFNIFISLIKPNTPLTLLDLSGPPGAIDALYSIVQKDPTFALKILLLINLNLALFNLLPIPILDGGQVLLSLLDKLCHNPLSEIAYNRIQMVSLGIILLFMIFLCLRDLIHILSKLFFKYG